MRHTTPERGAEDGSVLVYFLCVMLPLLAFAAGACLLSMVSQRAAGASADWARAFYLADSGAQIGNFLLRASNGTMAATSREESLGGGTTNIEIDTVSPSLYSVRSTGSISGASETVEMHVEFVSSFDMDGAIQINFDEQVEVSAPEILLELRSSAAILGTDHDAAGAVSADQSDASYGIAMSPVPGNVGIEVRLDIAGGAEVEGTPAQSTSSAPGQSEVFNALMDYARTNADVSISGGMTVTNADNGSYGTAAAPVLVYVDLEDNHTFLMRQNFVGYGTLVIEVGDVTEVPALYMEASTAWYGLVVVNFRGQAEIPGGALIEMENDALILGGLAMNFSGEDAHVTGDGLVFTAESGNPSVLYSSTILENAVGISEVVPKSARILSYRRVPHGEAN